MLEGLVLLIVLGVVVRFGALKRPGLVTGAFFLGYGIARTICEFFREPDAQLQDFTRNMGGLTMGMLLCIPLIAGRHRPHRSGASPSTDRKKWLTHPRRSKPKSAA